MLKRLVLFIVVVPMILVAQESNLGNWFGYFGSVQMNERWNWHNEIQYRNYNFIGDLEQLLIRTGFGYNLTEGNNNVLMGYGYILSSNYIEGTDNKESFPEHRIFQQFITRQNAWRVKLQHRYRFEQRFFEDDFKLRFRYFLSLNIPINKKEMEDHTWYGSVYNEIFINTENELFDRNRLYGGLGYKISPKLRFELAYMTQMFSEGSRDQINMVCFLNL
jgi:hypothetical protein